MLLQDLKYQETPITLVIVHHNEVSMAVVVDAVSLVSEAAASVAIEILEKEIVPELERLSSLDGNEIQAAIDYLWQRRFETFWLESVSPGSSKISGKIGIVILGGIGFLGGKVTGDVLDKSKTYDQVTTIIQEKLDSSADKILDKIKHSADKRNERPDGTISKFEIVRNDNRFEIYVHPAKRQLREH